VSAAALLTAQFSSAAATRCCSLLLCSLLCSRYCSAAAARCCSFFAAHFVYSFSALNAISCRSESSNISLVVLEGELRISMRNIDIGIEIPMSNAKFRLIETFKL
jgi:hypothetical protein